MSQSFYLEYSRLRDETVAKVDLKKWLNINVFGWNKEMLTVQAVKVT